MTAPLHIYQVVAAASNGVIGSNGELPWRIKDDMQLFVRLTRGKAILMGRKTFEALGKPLPGRLNIVLTRKGMDVTKWKTGDGDGSTSVVVISSIEEAVGVLAASDGPWHQNELAVIGGGEIYALTLPLADTVFLSRVDADVEGDTVFPTLDAAYWRLESSTYYPASEDNEYAFWAEKWERIVNNE